MGKWQDPRTPASVEYVGKFKVTIYDQAAYDQSLVDYPPDPPRLHPPKNVEPIIREKEKPAARYNWIVKLDRPLAG